MPSVKYAKILSSAAASLTLALSAFTAHAQTPAESGVEVEEGQILVLSETDSAPVQKDNKKRDINYADALVLGIVEGVTEYLPVSSTGHLIVADRLLGIDTNTPLSDAYGKPILTRKLEPFTMKMAADAYAIIIQFGAIMAVAILYFDYFMKMLFGLMGKNREGLRLFVNIVVAFLPAAIIGLACAHIIEEKLFGVEPVIAALAAGAVLMGICQKIYSKNAQKRNAPRLEDMTIKQSLLIGILQCVAMWPGTSRSMMTILGGYMAGLKPADAARFSFLLGFVTLTAASVYKTAKDGQNLLETLSIGPLAFGLVVAFVAAAISVKWMVGFLTRRGLAPFAWYRLLLAAVLWGMLAFDLL